MKEDARARRPSAEGSSGAGAPDTAADRSGRTVGSIGRGEWVSASAVRRAIGAWVYGPGAASAHPAPSQLRTAVAVASALCEQASELGDVPRLRPGALHEAGSNVPDPEPGPDGVRTDVAEDVADLAGRTGHSLREVQSAVELLTAARVVARTRSGGGGGGGTPSLRLSPDVLAPAPVVGRLAWPVIRGQIDLAGGGGPAALAVLRELAASAPDASIDDDRRSARGIRASVRDLEDSTGFGRSTVAEALTVLERAGLVGVETRAGRTTRFTLRPLAFGRAQPNAAVGAIDRATPVPAQVPPTSGRSTGGVGVGARRSTASVQRQHDVGERGGAGLAARAPAASPVAAPVTPSGVATAAATLIGSFAGTPIYAPPGTPLVVECDGAGQWTCRVGPFLTLGPVRE